MTASAAAVAAGLVAGLLQMIVTPASSPGMPTVSDNGTCTREIEGVEWFFDPCVPEGAPLPPDVITALEEDRLARECVPVTPTATAAVRRAERVQAATALPSAPAPTTLPPATPSANPTPPTSSSNPTPATPSWSPAPTATPCPSPTPTTPEPTPSWPEPTPTTPQPSPTQTSPEPDPGICLLPTSTADSRLAEVDPAKLREADKDKLCPPGRNPQTPVVVVATGDSLTSAHIQIRHHHEPKKCRVNGNTQADHRGLPGNDMKASYVGKYVNNNNSVVDYYNFARTGMGTTEILSAPATYEDACENAWNRAFPPIALAEAAIAKAKQDGRQAYYVTTGGINNTNWSRVAAGAAMCGMAEFLRVQLVRFYIRNNLPFNAVMRYYNTVGAVTNRDAIIRGGACQVVLQENVTGDRPREVTIARLRFDIPVYDGPTHYAAITRDVGIITARALAAGADKQVWMGYYDITPAKVAMGNFASTWVQNTDLPDAVKGALPNIPNVETDLVTGQAWKTQVQTWTNELNNAIKASILPNDPKIRFQKAPALGADKIQKTMIGGCPHPNIPGHEALAASLDAAFRALGP